MTLSPVSRSPAWAGEVHLGDGWLCFIGPIGSTAQHAHHAVQIVVSAELFRLHDGVGGSVEAAAAVIPSDAVHSLTADGQPGWLLYLQHVRGGSSDDARQWAEDARRVEVPTQGAEPAAWVSTVAAQLRSVHDDEEGFVEAAMAAARNLLPGQVRLADIASLVGVAAGTLSRRFSQVVGVPWRQWILAERLLLAASALAAGDNLTTAAHAAGFADSAHLSRTFRRMFGIAPSDLTAVATWHMH